MRKIISFILCILLLTSFKIDISAASSLRIALMISDDSEKASSEINGYTIRYLKEVLSYANKGLVLDYCKDSECAYKLENGEVDAVMGVHNQLNDYDYVESVDFITSTRNIGIYVDEDYHDSNFKEFLQKEERKIGIINNSFYYDSISAYSNIYNIKYQFVNYQNFDEMLNALKNKEIDAFIYKELPLEKPVKLAINISFYNTHFAVLKNSEVYYDLQDALVALVKADPDYENNLYKNYFKTSIASTTELNEEEKKYVDSIDAIRVAINPDYAPLEYFKDGSAHGITIDILNAISEETNIKFEIVETTSLQESVELLKKGTVDMLSGSEAFLKLLEGDFNITDSYLSIATNQYTNSENKGVMRNVGLVSYFMDNAPFITKLYPSLNVVECENVSMCLAMLENGEIDVTSFNTYVADYAISKNGFKKIDSNAFNSIPDNMAFAFSKYTNPLLLGIFNKGLDSINNDTKMEIVYKNISNYGFAQSFISFIKNNPLIMYGILIAVIVLILIQFAYMINQKNNHNKAISKVAYNDTLTNYGNFNYFKDESYKILHKASPNMHYAVITLVVGKIQNINILLGTIEGQGIIIKVANILHDTLSNDECFGRVNKDEFVILKHFEDYEDIPNWINEMQKSINDYLLSQTISSKVYLNAGIYEIMDIDVAIEDPVEKSYYALKSIIENTGTRAVYYDYHLNDQILLENKIESMMDLALEKKEFEVYLQPKYSMLSNSIVGAEALIRWNSLTEGLLFPGQFIPIFEKNGFIKHIDFYVYEVVLSFLSEYMKAHKTMIPISFNLSRIHLHSPTLVDDLVAMADKYNVPHRYIEIELTETAFFEDSEGLLDIMARLKAKGFRIAMDDFGTGYSSLNLLKDMPLDVVKIDKSFLPRGQIRKEDRIVLQSIINMVRQLNLEVITEGVETQEQVNVLKSVNCFLAQGYLYSRPVPLDVFKTMVKDM